MLTVDNIHTYYGQSHVLRGVSLEIPPRSVVALLGRNGMGKSTTVHSIMGFTPPHQGRVLFHGREIQYSKPNQIARMGVALVPQGKRLFPSLSVRENLTVGTGTHGTGKRWTVQDMYRMFPVLEKRANFGGTLLSGGEQQMLSVARALMTGPDLILMDEPSEGLAPLLVTQLGGIIRELRDVGLSVLLVEQNLGLALSVADHVYVMNKGMIVYSGTPEALNADEAVKTRHLGASV